MLFAQEPQLLKDMNPTGNSFIRDVVEVNGKTFLLIDPTSNQSYNLNTLQLWVTDGSSAGTVKLIENFLVYDPAAFFILYKNLHVMNGLVYFSYFPVGGTGSYLYQTDGTVTGTIQVPGSPINFAHVTQMMVFNNSLYFSAEDAASGMELWKYDGTNTSLLKEFIPGGGVNFGNGGYPQNFTVYNNKLFFVAATFANAAEIWSTDGTLAGTTLLLDINTTPLVNSNFINNSSNPKNLTVAAGKLFFSANDGILGSELWVTDGTAAGTQLVKDINTNLWTNGQPGNRPSSPAHLYEANGSLFFAATDNNSHHRLFVTDGTSAGTIKLADVHLSDGSGGEKLIGPDYNGFLYLAADDLVNGNELWFTNGTAANTAMYQNMNVATGAASYPFSRVAFNDKLYFTATTVQGTASGLYETDGNPAFTQLVQPIGTTLTNHNPGKIFVTSDRIYYSAQYQSGVGSEPYFIVGESTKLWTGNTSTNWFTASNWEPQQVPVDTNDVLIPAGLTNYPVIISGTAKCRKFNIKTGATLTMTGGTLNVYGNFQGQSSTCFNLTGGTVKLYGGGDFPNSIQFNNLTLTSLNTELLSNSYTMDDLAGINGNLVMSGTAQGNILDYPTLHMLANDDLYLKKNLTLNQGRIGFFLTTLPLADNTKLPNVVLNGTTQQNLSFSNEIGIEGGSFAGLVANLNVFNPAVKLVNTGKPIFFLNLHLYADFNLRGTDVTLGGKIIYYDNVNPTCVIKNSTNFCSLTIRNDARYSPDTEKAYFRCGKLGGVFSHYSVPIQKANDTIVFLSDVAVDWFAGLGYIDLNGKNLTIGKTTSYSELSGSEIGTTIKTGTLKLLGNASSIQFELKSRSLNNLIVNTPAGLKLNSIVDNVSNALNIYGTVRLINGSLDRNNVNIKLVRDTDSNNPNVAKLIETAPHRCYSDVASGIEFDTTYTEPLTNVNPGGLGFFITTPEDWLNKITITRINGQGVGAVWVGNNIADRVYLVKNENPGGNLNARIKIKYDENELNGIPENELRIYRYNSFASNPFELLPSTVNTTTNIVSTTTDLFSLDASVASPMAYFLGQPSLPPNRQAAPAPASVANTLQLKAYPNPFTKQFNIGFNAQVKEDAQLTVMDISGRVFHTAAVQITEGDNTLNVCCLDNAPSGVYFVNLKTSTGNNMVRLIKNN